MENNKYAEAKQPSVARDRRSPDGAYGFSFSIALGLVLFIAGLVISLTVSGGSGVGLLFGLPLLMAGVVVPLFMMRNMFTGSEVIAPCPYCGASIKTTDATIKMNCPECRKRIAVRDAKFVRDEVTQG